MFTVDVEFKDGRRIAPAFVSKSEAVAYAGQMAQDSAVALSSVRGLAMDDLAKTVSKAKLLQKIRDGDWEVDVDIEPAIQNRRAIEVRTHDGKKFWVRVE